MGGQAGCGGHLYRVMDGLFQAGRADGGTGKGLRTCSMRVGCNIACPWSSGSGSPTDVELS